MYDEAVGIVGGGIMGAGIAEVPARDGFDGRVREVDGAAAQTACWRATPRRSPS
jgi:3-hydroxybutyryl-CoA dehydrogenase